MTKIRDQMCDHIMPDLDQASFWAEHIIRHNGFPSEYYERRGMNLNIVQYLNLDVVFVCSVILVGVIIAVIRLCVMCYRLNLFHRSKQ